MAEKSEEYRKVSTGKYEQRTFKKGDQYIAAYHPMFAVYTTNCDPSNSNIELKQPYDYTKPNYTSSSSAAVDSGLSVALSKS